MKKILLFVILLTIPIVCDATVITYDDAQMKFEIDENKWKKSDIVTNSTLDKKWVNDCGMIMTGTYDLYSILSYDSKKEVGGREYYNYKNNSDVIDEDGLSQFKELLEKIFVGMKFNDLQSVSFGTEIPFSNVFGTLQGENETIKYDGYYVTNNGYQLQINYMGNDNNTCLEMVHDIVLSAKPIGDVKELESDDSSSGNDIVYVIGDLIIIIGIPALIIYLIVRNKKQKGKPANTIKFAKKIKIEEDDYERR